MPSAHAHAPGRFRRLFRGRRSAYGQYPPTESAETPRTIRDVQEIPEEAWDRHLAGKGAGLGVVPIDENDECHFGAIDVDDEEFDHAACAAKAEDLDLPLVVCRSKSGGAHLYLFLRSPAPAGEVRTFLSKCVDVLDLREGGFDAVFPKQDSVEEGGVGNWINLPYYSGDETERYAVGVEGGRLDLEGFLALAEGRTIEPDELGSWGKTVRPDPKGLTDRIVEFVAPIYPAEGGRHDFVLGLCGEIAGRDHPEAMVREVIRRLMDQVADEESGDRLRCVDTTFEKIRNGEEVAGLDESVREKLIKDSDLRELRKLLGDRPKIGKKSQADLLVECAESAELFHDADDETYALVDVNGHHEVHALQSRGFSRWLTGEFYARFDKGPNDSALRTALSTLDARAKFEGEERETFVRFAGDEEQVYYDLADERWNVVEVDPEGWRVIFPSPIAFRRPPGVAPQVIPAQGGDIERLWPFFRHAGRVAFTLIVGALLGSLCPWGSYPILVLNGPKGSAKSTVVEICRRILDPSTAPHQGLPQETRDLLIAARNSRVLALDNVSYLSPAISDDLCRIATGGSIRTRRLYSNDEETIVTVKRPVIANGIGDFVTRGDMLDRSIIVSLPRIDEADRRTERELWSEVDKALPYVLGALFDGVSAGLSRWDEVRLNYMPRLADFARWVTAGEVGLGWEEGTILDAFRANQQEGTLVALEASLVAGALIRFMSHREEWCGSTTQLLAALEDREAPGTEYKKGWPGSPSVLGKELSRLEPDLGKIGLAIERTWTHGGREITLRNDGLNEGAAEQVEALFGAEDDDAPSF